MGAAPGLDSVAADILRRHISPAGVPRLFVGQVPTTCSEEDLVPVFAPYGEIEKVSLVRGPDHKSRGCCMVRACGGCRSQIACRASMGACRQVFCAAACHS